MLRWTREVKLTEALVSPNVPINPKGPITRVINADYDHREAPKTITDRSLESQNVIKRIK